MTTIVVFALEMNPKEFDKKLKELEIKGRIEVIQETALLISTRILRRVQET